MARASNADIALYTLGTDYLAWVKSADFDWEIALGKCSGINNRYQKSVENRRKLMFSAVHNRKPNSAGVCQSNKSVSIVSLDKSYVASWESIDFGFTNSSSPSNGGGDVLGTVQLHRPTSISGSINVFVDTGTKTLISQLISSGTGVDVTFTYTDGVGAYTVETALKKITKTWPESGLIMMTLAFEDGIVTSAGGGLFAIGCAGSGQVAFAANDGVDNISGTAVILSGNVKVPYEGMIEENYSFHVNSVTDNG